MRVWRNGDHRQRRQHDGEVADFVDEPAGEGPPVATTRGLRTLYVALTRPTKRLAVVHVDPLPVELL